MAQYGLTVDDMKSLPFVEEHKWSVSGYVNESEDDTEDPQKMLEIRYLNGVEKEMECFYASYNKESKGFRDYIRLRISTITNIVF